MRMLGEGLQGQGRRVETGSGEEVKAPGGGPMGLMGPMGTVPGQLAKDFLALVKKGNIKEILSFIRIFE